MTRLVAALVLLFVAAAALALREVPAPGYRAPEGARGVPNWLVDDPDAAYHLRRVELALAAGTVPRFDRYLDHPHGSAVPWPPFADGLFGFVAGVAAKGDPGDPEDRALGGHAEDRIEAVLVHFPPILGALAALAVFAATWVLCDPGVGRFWAAALAAWIYAALPTAVWYGGVTRLDHHVLVALLLALHLALVTASLRARQSLDAMSGALAAGVVAGLAIASWLASGVFVALAGAAWFLRALGPDDERARLGARSAVLYLVAAAGVTLYPASTSAWNAVQPGSLINMTEGVPRALFVALVPFVVLLFGRRRAAGGRVSRSRLGVLALVLLAVAVGLLPGFLDGVREGFRWASRENLFMDVVAESRPLDSVGTIVSQLSYLAFLFPIALVVLLPSAVARAERAHLLLLAAALGWMTLSQQRFGNALAVPFACVLAVALHDLMGSLRAARGRAAVGAGMGVAALALVPSVLGVLGTTKEEYADLADYRAELLRGLRWVRTGTPSPGPWNAPEHPQDWGVLSSWGLGHLIEYHARRPTIATNFGSFVGQENFRESARALLETDPLQLVRRMRELGADYVVVTPRLVADLGATMRIAGEDPASLFEREPGGPKHFGRRATESALWRLALHDQRPGSHHYPGLELVWASPRRETPNQRRPRPGEPSGPVLSIYALLDGGGRPAAPSIEAGR